METMDRDHSQAMLDLADDLSSAAGFFRLWGRRWGRMTPKQQARARTLARRANRLITDLIASRKLYLAPDAAAD
jgi:hypothetical protein